MFFVQARELKVAFFYKEFDLDLVVSLQSIRIIDRTPYLHLVDAYRADQSKVKLLASFHDEIDEVDRYQTLLQSVSSHDQADQDNIVKIVMSFKDIKSAYYADIEIDLKVAISSVHINFNPIPMNRLLRLLRLFRYPTEEMEK